MVCTGMNVSSHEKAVYGLVSIGLVSEKWMVRFPCASILPTTHRLGARHPPQTYMHPRNHPNGTIPWLPIEKMAGRRRQPADGATDAVDRPCIRSVDSVHCVCLTVSSPLRLAPTDWTTTDEERGSWHSVEWNPLPILNGGCASTTHAGVVVVALRAVTMTTHDDSYYTTVSHRTSGYLPWVQHERPRPWHLLLYTVAASGRPTLAAHPANRMKEHHS